MKKSKFLLLGSVASLGFNSLRSSKCGETKEEETKEPDNNQVETWNTKRKHRNTGKENLKHQRNQKQPKEPWKPKEPENLKTMKT
ncbi:hypothetical protein HYD74_03855 [Mycoplasmopsis bovis]|nr:hypothetical protein HYD74_03855 [Mycoplasmopsis bovis]